MAIVLYRDGDSIEEQEIHLPVKFEICSTCRGKGSSSSYLGAFTREDMDEMGEEFFEDYRRGNYDRACDECKGLRVVEVVDRENCDPALLEEYDKQCQEEYLDAHISRMERMLGGDY